MSGSLFYLLYISWRWNLTSCASNNPTRARQSNASLCSRMSMGEKLARRCLREKLVFETQITGNCPREHSFWNQFYGPQSLTVVSVWDPVYGAPSSTAASVWNRFHGPLSSRAASVWNFVYRPVSSTAHSVSPLCDATGISGNYSAKVGRTNVLAVDTDFSTEYQYIKSCSMIFPYHWGNISAVVFFNDLLNAGFQLIAGCTCWRFIYVFQMVYFWRQ